MKVRQDNHFRPGTLLRKLFVHNGLVKLACLALAFVTWQAVRQNTGYEVLVADVPVEVMAPEGMAVLDQTASTVQIRFRGAREDIRFISRDQVAVALELSGRGDRLRQTVKLSPRLVKAPSRAQAVQFDPPELTVLLDREVERVVPVKASLEGTLPEGIRLGKAVCDPATVRVRGAEQHVRDLDQVLTRPISLDGRSTPFRIQTAVVSGGHHWSVSPERVTVELSLVEDLETRHFESLPVRPLLPAGEARSVRIEPESVHVTVSGIPRRVQRLTRQDLFPYVDCTELTEPAEYEVTIRADVPSGIRVNRIDPPAVRVTVERM